MTVFQEFSIYNIRCYLYNCIRNTLRLTINNQPTHSPYLLPWMQRMLVERWCRIYQSTPAPTTQSSSTDLAAHPLSSSSSSSSSSSVIQHSQLCKAMKPHKTPHRRRLVFVTDNVSLTVNLCLNVLKDGDQVSWCCEYVLLITVSYSIAHSLCEPVHTAAVNDVTQSYTCESQVYDCVTSFTAAVCTSCEWRHSSHFLTVLKMHYGSEKLGKSGNE